MIKKAVVVHYLNSNSASDLEDLESKILENNVTRFNYPESSLRNISNYFCPGTILAKNTKDEYIICFPMMSSHFSLPLKQGELVWYFTDDEIVNQHDEFDLIATQHPLLNINNYWISRIHGSVISEDLNYTHKERDTEISSNIDISENSAKLPDFKNYNLFMANNFNVDESETSYLYDSGSNKSFLNKATPRKFSKSDELTLQGSYNTSINLTKDDQSSDGKIDIVAGHMSLQDYFIDDNQQSLKIENKTLTNYGNLEVNRTLSKQKFMTTKNSELRNELLKCPEKYFFVEDTDFNQYENLQLNFYDLDASRILLSEKIDIDDGSYYRTDYLKKIKYFPNDQEESLLTQNYSKEYLRDVEIEIENSKETNFTSELSSFNDLPGIMLKTNNIRIVARQEESVLNAETSLSKEEMQAGSIRLVKESKSFKEYSHISLEPNGKISIDSQLIKLGSLLKEYVKFNNVTLEDANNLFYNTENNDLINDESIKSLHGKGTGLLIGNHEALSEPLVLGNTLKSFLTEILTINIEALGLIADALTQIKENFDKVNDNNNNILTYVDTFLSTHTHNIVSPAPSSPVTPPVPPINSNATVFLLDDTLTNIIENTADMNKNEESQRLQGVIDNLVEMLSRFAKTT